MSFARANVVRYSLPAARPQWQSLLPDEKQTRLFAADLYNAGIRQPYTSFKSKGVIDKWLVAAIIIAVRVVAAAVATPATAVTAAHATAASVRRDRAAKIAKSVRSAVAPKTPSAVSGIRYSGKKTQTSKNCDSAAMKPDVAAYFPKRAAINSGLISAIPAGYAAKTSTAPEKQIRRFAKRNNAKEAAL